MVVQLVHTIVRGGLEALYMYTKHQLSYACVYIYQPLPNLPISLTHVCVLALHTHCCRSWKINRDYRPWKRNETKVLHAPSLQRCLHHVIYYSMHNKDINVGTGCATLVSFVFHGLSSLHPFFKYLVALFLVSACIYMLTVAANCGIW